MARPPRRWRNQRVDDVAFEIMRRAVQAMRDEGE